MKVVHTQVPSRGTESGTFYLDVNTKKLTMTDATPIHDAGRDACVSAWGNIRLISLSEKSMQLGVIRTSCDGPALMVYNYVAQQP